LGYSGTLVVSQDLALEYPEPELISHSSNMLILKYADWVLSHQVVDGESMYSQVGLTGVTGEFIQSIFIPEKRSVLPNWLQLLAEEQGREFGLPEGEVIGQKIGEFELLGTYSKQHRSGYLYVFDRAAIHHIVIQGTEEREVQRPVDRLVRRCGFPLSRTASVTLGQWKCKQTLLSSSVKAKPQAQNSQFVCLANRYQRLATLEIRTAFY
jgi:hypothetical protein